MVFLVQSSDPSFIKRQQTRLCKITRETRIFQVPVYYHSLYFLSSQVTTLQPYPFSTLRHTTGVKVSRVTHWWNERGVVLYVRPECNSTYSSLKLKNFFKWNSYSYDKYCRSCSSGKQTCIPDPFLGIEEGEEGRVVRLKRGSTSRKVQYYLVLLSE